MESNRRGSGIEDSAVGLEYNKSPYGFTITSSPYKKFFDNIPFKDCTEDQQKQLFKQALSKWNYHEIHFEKCKNNNIHVHGIIKLTKDQSLIFLNEMWDYFGYRGKSNKVEHFIVLKPCDVNFCDYIQKEEKIITKDQFERLAEIDEYKGNVAMDEFKDYVSDLIQKALCCQ